MKTLICEQPGRLTVIDRPAPVPGPGPLSPEPEPFRNWSRSEAGVNEAILEI